MIVASQLRTRGAVLLAVAVLLISVGVSMGAPAPFTYATNWEEEITAGLTPGIPTIAMPEMPGIGVWNVAASDGTVTGGIVCAQSTCGRTGEWRGIYPPDGSPMFWNPIGAASWGRYYTNGLYVWGGGYVLPGTTTNINPSSPTTAPPPAETTTTAPLATDGSVYGVEGYIINSNGMRCHLTADGYWDFVRSCVDSSRVQFAMCFQSTASQISFSNASLKLSVLRNGITVGSTSFPAAGVTLRSASSCLGGYVHSWSFDGAEPGTTYLVRVNGSNAGQSFSSQWSFTTPTPPPPSNGSDNESTLSASPTTAITAPTTSATTTTTAPTTSATSTTTTSVPPATSVTSTSSSVAATTTDGGEVTVSAAASTVGAQSDRITQADEVADVSGAIELSSIPVAPAAAPGQGATTVDGVTSQAQVRLEDGAAVISVGSISTRITALDASGNIVHLGSSRLDLARARVLRIDVEGLSGSRQIEVWMMSNPRLLGILEVGADGLVSGEVPLTAGIETGAHRLVLAGVSADGHSAQMAFGITVQGEGDSKLRTQSLLLVAVVMVALMLIGMTRRLLINR